MEITFMSQFYEQVAVLWGEGKSPTVKATVTNPDTNLPVFHFVNDNTTDANGNVQSSIELFRSTNGLVEAGNFGTKGSVTLNSQGYSPTFFFQQIGSNLGTQMMEFVTTADVPQGSPNFVLSFEIYYPPFGPLTDSAVLRQNKGYGATGDSCCYKNGVSNCSNGGICLAVDVVNACGFCA